MPLDAVGGWRRDQVVPSEDVLARINDRWPIEAVTPGDADAAPADRYRFCDGGGEVGVVASVTRPFCGTCNRLRLTADGAVRNCLFSDDEVSAAGPVRDGGGDEDIGHGLAPLRVGQAAWPRHQRTRLPPTVTVHVHDRRLRVMKVVVIGATGHIGTYLVPRLVVSGHEVIAMSRGRRLAWSTGPGTRSSGCRSIGTPGAKATFAPRVAALRPDAVVDLMCFSVPSARQLTEALAPVGSVPAALRDHLGARQCVGGARRRGRGEAPLRRLRFAKSGLFRRVSVKRAGDGARRHCLAAGPYRRSRRHDRTHMPGCKKRLGATAWSWSASVPDGHLSTRPATPTSTSSAGWPGATSWLFLTSASKPSTTSMPTTSPRAWPGPFQTLPPLPARPSIRLRARPYPAATPRAWPPGSARPPGVRPALGGLGRRLGAPGCPGHVGPHCPQSLDEHRQGHRRAGLRASLSSLEAVFESLAWLVDHDQVDVPGHRLRRDIYPVREPWQ